MAFLGLWHNLSKKFNKRRTYRKQFKQSAATYDKKISVPQTDTTNSAPSAKTTVQSESFKLMHTKTTAKQVALLITYRNEAGQDLCAPELIYGQKHSAVHIEFKEFKNYNLTQIKGFTTTLVDDYGLVTLIYRAQDAGVLWLFCRDIDDFHLLQEPQFISGKMQEKYSLVSPELAGYTLLRAEGQLRGVFERKQKIATFFYRKKEWLKVIYEQKCLQMNTFVKCFASPAGKELKITLAKGTIWQIFESIQLADESWWHCMGGNVWIKDDSNAFSEVQNASPNLSADWQMLGQLNTPTKAIIDYVPNKKLTVYDQPFGKPTAKISDHSKVSLKQHVTIHGLDWYLIANKGWIIKQYLKFID